MMGVSRSGYYKWKAHTPTARDLKREEMIAIVADAHEHHRTHGYRWTAAFIWINMRIHISESYTYECFRFLGIQAETCHKPHPRPRKEKDKYPNLIFSTWDTVDRPRQVIVSDMTALKLRYGTYYEITFYFDVFTKEILAWRVGQRRGARDQYIDGLKDVVDQLKGCTEPTIAHTDQGSVYASMAYNELIKDTVIVRSMSRAGKPTDNPVNESLNGWIKEEIISGFNLDARRYIPYDEIKLIIGRYVKYFNTQRPCYAIDYDTPENYRKRYYKGGLSRKDTFKNRNLTPEPKFVQKRRKAFKNQDIVKECPLLETETSEND